MSTNQESQELVLSPAKAALIAARKSRLEMDKKNTQGNAQVAMDQKARESATEVIQEKIAHLSSILPKLQTAADEKAQAYRELKATFTSKKKMKDADKALAYKGLKAASKALLNAEFALRDTEIQHAQLTKTPVEYFAILRSNYEDANAANAAVPESHKKGSDTYVTQIECEMVVEKHLSALTPLEALVKKVHALKANYEKALEAGQVLEAAASGSAIKESLEALGFKVTKTVDEQKLSTAVDEFATAATKDVKIKKVARQKKNCANVEKDAIFRNIDAEEFEAMKASPSKASGGKTFKTKTTDISRDHYDIAMSDAREKEDSSSSSTSGVNKSLTADSASSDSTDSGTQNMVYFFGAMDGKCLDSMNKALGAIQVYLDGE